MQGTSACLDTIGGVECTCAAGLVYNGVGCTVQSQPSFAAGYFHNCAIVVPDGALSSCVKCFGRTPYPPI